MIQSPHENRTSFFQAFGGQPADRLRVRWSIPPVLWIRHLQGNYLLHRTIPLFRNLRRGTAYSPPVKLIHPLPKPTACPRLHAAPGTKQAHTSRGAYLRSMRPSNKFQWMSHRGLKKARRPQTADPEKNFADSVHFSHHFLIQIDFAIFPLALTV